MAPLVPLLIASAALASVQVPDSVSRVLDTLVGKWMIVETTAGKQSQGSENWSVAIPGRMYSENYDAGTGESRTRGSATLWRGADNTWRAVWCTGQQGCIQLLVDQSAGELRVRADETAPVELRVISERFNLRSRNHLEQVLEACPAPATCQRITTVQGTRR